MSGLYPLTVNTDPSAEPHIYAEDDAAIYQSMFGSDGVCNIGQNCAATVISNNKVRVADGVICVGGHMARVRYGEYQDCEIMNGQTGYNRNDIIVAKFVTTGAQGTDTYTIEVVQGTAVAGDATDPALTQGDLYEGDKIRMMPLYRVKIEGLSIVAVEQLFEVIPTIPELQAQVAELNGKLIHGTAKIRNPIGDTECNVKTITVTLPRILENSNYQVLTTLNAINSFLTFDYNFDVEVFVSDKTSNSFKISVHRGDSGYLADGGTWIVDYLVIT